ncbi:hypothetical protein EXIGLDRAFT_364283 [Exidia glandulosa HHB12029]|uniref:Uncharacterized protein n=1 Tax=Exidia glandulosa HHB12029 TaxID=1314781 RepID=A0A165C444_EXIGL|nr:hypothetical protein EXIGLDRAFT_364283 [Exidia glandulosa HHB12029]
MPRAFPAPNLASWSAPSPSRHSQLGRRRPTWTPRRRARLGAVKIPATMPGSAAGVSTTSPQAPTASRAYSTTSPSPSPSSKAPLRALLVLRCSACKTHQTRLSVPRIPARPAPIPSSSIPMMMATACTYLHLSSSQLCSFTSSRFRRSRPMCTGRVASSSPALAVSRAIDPTAESDPPRSNAPSRASDICRYSAYVAARGRFSRLITTRPYSLRRHFLRPSTRLGVTQNPGTLTCRRRCIILRRVALRPDLVSFEMASVPSRARTRSPHSRRTQTCS